MQTMNKTCLLLAATVLLGGCDKQTKINSAKIEILSQKIVQLEQTQSKQLAAIQSQLASLAPMLDKMNDFYFEKTHDEAFFFHTNTLYLLLTVDKKIESHLQLADTERESERELAFYYHTNETDTMYFCTAQIQDALTGQEKRIVDNVNAATRRVGTNVSEVVLKQIKLSAPDAAETARRQQLAADVAQIKRDLEAIKVRLGITNQPATGP
jgi:outer membrane murein-binding lipoprotein Lpp